MSDTRQILKPAILWSCIQRKIVPRMPTSISFGMDDLFWTKIDVPLVD